MDILDNLEFKSYKCVGKSILGDNNYRYEFETHRKDINKTIFVELLIKSDSLKVDLEDRSIKLSLLKRIIGEIEVIEELEASIRSLSKVNSTMGKFLGERGVGSGSNIDEYIRIKDNAIKYKEFFS